jgi:hypothetical protein
MVVANFKLYDYLEAHPRERVIEHHRLGSCEGEAIGPDSHEA